MKIAILSTYNDDIDPNFPKYQHMVMEKLGLLDYYRPLKYGFHHSVLLHGDVLNKAVNTLFYEQGYNAVLIMDVDCIPVTKLGIAAIFDLIHSDVLVGNAQQSHHIRNNNHMYAASSFIGFSESVYRKLGRPSMLPTYEGDTCEQLTYNAERFGVDIHLLNPITIDSENERGELWSLPNGLSYGIGTTFAYNSYPVSYHLFGSRLNLFNQYFFNKCKNIIDQQDVR